MSDLVGTWRLRSMEATDASGRVSHPLGSDARGLLVYTADGYMSVAIMQGERLPAGTRDWRGGSDEVMLAAARGYLSYAGRYELRGDHVLHRVEVALFPDWVGSTQVRYVHLAGDQLTLRARPAGVDGRTRGARLLWERVHLPG